MALGTRGTYLEFVRVRSNDRSDLFTVLHEDESWHSFDSNFGGYLL